jgi:hypothetical protein
MNGDAIKVSTPFSPEATIHVRISSGDLGAPRLTRHAAAVAVLCGAALAGGWGASAQTTSVAVLRAVEARSLVPPPPLVRVVPHRYRVTGIWRGNLTGGNIEDVVVASAGPASGRAGLRVDLQVLSWDGHARHWTVTFDAARANGPVVFDTRHSNTTPGIRVVPKTTHGPLFGGAATAIGPVRFAPILRTRREQLIFYVASVAPANQYGTLIIVDFTNGSGSVLYSWDGDFGLDWNVNGGRISARASYWAPGDAHCCPIRTYRFVLAYRGGSITEIADQRPWLGVIVREPGRFGNPFGALRVIRVARRSPAAGILRTGDVILDVLNAPHRGVRGIFDRLSELNAGQVARLLIIRGGTRLVVKVRLGSLMNALGQFLPKSDYAVEAL